MGLLSKFARRSEAPPSLITDCWEFNPETQPVRAAAQAGDWPATRALLDRVPNPTTGRS